MQEFLLEQSTIQADGTGPEIALGSSPATHLKVTLGITRIVEQESLDVSIWGSPDKVAWGSKPLFSFPQKFYCGHYTLFADLTSHPETQYLQVRWKAHRWGRGEPKPLFTIYVFAETVQANQATAA